MDSRKKIISSAARCDYDQIICIVFIVLSVGIIALLLKKLAGISPEKCKNLWTSSVWFHHGFLYIIKVAFISQFILGQIKVNDCPTGFDNWPRRVRAPRRGQKQEKSYCDYLKKHMMSPNRRGPNLLRQLEYNIFEMLAILESFLSYK